MNETATNSLVPAIRLALESDRTVNAIVHDADGYRRDGVIDMIYDDDTFSFVDSERDTLSYISARDVVEIEVVD